MSEGFFHKIRDYFTRNSVVSKVASDPAIAAELLLLIKIIFADGNRVAAETKVFSQIAQEQFGIPANTLPDVIRYLGDYCYETTTVQAAAIFSGFAHERRFSLVRNLLAIACADNFIDENEIVFIERVSAILGVTPQELNDILNNK